jgi:hypothetical protein
MVAAYVLLCAFSDDVRLSDTADFPSYEVCLEYRIFAVKHVEWLERQQNYNSDDSYRDWHREAYFRFQIWNALEDAVNVRNAEGWRLARLRDFRTHIGCQAYYARRVPAPVPLHWFRRIE